ncbi:DUF4278 domain-containing protein [Nodosilinea sp. LEGE 06152]|uniref:DUF4278 domain-containing protein n=1 Tax=Cyanophyceae TaxID=3028117 RepID=UPI001880F81F|nr:MULTISPECIES: DUF4278 domain-containing protein [Cyanophyceae]MBE9160077.1 DUF4278 domain-containing protein [Nodosilinea sp. LEGE 06152]MEA5448284.1 DUF4278 domain-containing protein [Leptolyngbya sp. CCNP1308]
MTLQYRGISYEAAAPQSHIFEESIGRYRGAANVRHVCIDEHPESHIEGLKYRGAVVR